jgi:hypothetical protein
MKNVVTRRGWARENCSDYVITGWQCPRRQLTISLALPLRGIIDHRS